MGRKTFESLPGVLPNRRHSIVTRDPGYKVDNVHCTVYLSLEKALDAFKNVDNHVNELFIIGGGEIYKQVLDLGVVDAIYLTVIDAEFYGDVFFSRDKRKRI